jgi:hypothetical protein
VGVVLTSGAEGFMKAEDARLIAEIMDEKALGERDAPEPTPIVRPTAAGN